jgi:hypothetical protein
MFNVECSMLNEEAGRGGTPVALPFNIEHSTFNIQHLLLEPPLAQPSLREV